ncbi:nacht and tpr domain-containing protein [Diplodia corticola]|uniref:Nacht and tpr domain-containing protein n=1 Tax=Diplodia corticola TaxID=236234 RepID=A0A1J9S464_9PEZI|nr:nacht and tpr domain-containing protein [Diplodia corticola]OJD35327.1 nacht and tpr domain-containing protein [Diplodia corticola]
MAAEQGRTADPDLVRLWHDAIEDFKGKAQASKDWDVLKTIIDTQKHRSWVDIKQDPESWKNTFEKKRHPQDRLSRFRTATNNIFSSLEKFVGVFGFAVEVTAAAIPQAAPASFIIQAFSAIMESFSRVSDAFDNFMSFCESMSDTFCHLGELEGQLSEKPVLSTDIVQVFRSTLQLCAVAIQKPDKRIKIWYKSTFKGGDKELDAAFEGIKKSINRLDLGLRVASYVTLQELKKMHANGSVEMNKTLKAIQLNVDESDKYDKKQLAEISQYLATIDQGSMRTEKQLSVIIQQLQRTANPARGVQESGRKTKKNLATRKDQVIAALEEELSSLDLTEYIQDQEEWLFAPSCDWFHDRDEYKQWCKDPEARILWVTGKPGCGKTFLALSTLKRLEGQNESVGYFFFREDRVRQRELDSALGTMAVQIAKSDTYYSRKISADLKKDGNPKANGQGSADLWKRLFANQFTEEMTDPVFLIFDGIDEASKDSQEALCSILAKIAEGTTRVHVLVTGQDASIPVQAEPGTKVVDMSGSGLKKAYRLLCSERIGKSMRRLKKFSKPTKRKIAKVLSENADGMLYIENMLCRLEAIGLEKPVLDEISTQVPEDIHQVYELMLRDCRKGRNEDQAKALQDVFAWLAFARQRMTLQQAAAIAQLSLQDKSSHLVIEHEIVGKLSDILEIVRSEDTIQKSFDDQETPDVEDGGHASDESEELLTLADDFKRPIQFQERSLRDFFKNVPDGEKKLRQTPYAAHLTIFLMCAKIITRPQSAEEEDSSTPDAQLEAYASDFFAEHLTEISPGGRNSMHKIPTQDRKDVVEALAGIMTNKNNVCARLERHAQRVFSKISKDGDWRSTVREWADIPSESFHDYGLSEEAARWVSSVKAEHSLGEMMIPLAKGHAENLMRESNPWQAQEIYRFAADAFLLTNMCTEAMRDESYDINSKDSVDAILKSLFNTITVDDEGLANRAIGMIQYILDHADADVLLRAVEGCKKRFDKSSCSMVLAYISFLENRYTEGMKHAERALEFLQQAEQEDVSAPALRSRKSSALVGIAVMKARLVSDGGDTELLKAVVDCLHDAFDVSEEYAYPEALSLLISSATVLNGVEKLTEEFGKWPEKHQRMWLDGAFEEQHQGKLDMFKEGAVLSGRTDLITHWYKRLCKAPREDPQTKAWAVYELINTYRFTLNQRDNAERELDLLLRAANSPSLSSWFHMAQRDKADILYDKFRHSNTVKEKEEYLEKMRKLLKSEDNDKSFGLYDSLASIQHARMVRVVGKPAEYIDVLKRTFDTCVDSLEDEILDNDGSSFRLLAKTLTCLPDMKQQAKVALSLQFSMVDTNLTKLSNEEGRGHDVEDGDAECDENQEHSQESGSEPQDELSKVSEESDVYFLEMDRQFAGEPTEEDLSKFSIYCDGCAVGIGWWEKPMYLCLICTDCDLCSRCLKRLKEAGDDRPEGSWHYFCGKDHKYIRGPMDGWKGVKDGEIHFGDESLGFKDWLKRLKSEWARACERFLAADSFVHDIF